jgi:CheY-like chemotaxis protein
MTCFQSEAPCHSRFISPPFTYSENLHVPDKLLLIAEDNDEDYGLLREALVKISPSTQPARVRNGEELLEYLYSRSLPDLIVLDLRMPKMGGAEALKEIRGNPLFSKVAVIVLSIRNNPKEKAALQALGIDGYFVKPAYYEESARFVREFERFGFEMTA